MDDRSTTVAEIREQVMAFARERDWERFHSPKNLSMALAAEAAELLEHFLWCEGPESRRLATLPPKDEQVQEELADILIYAIEFANVCGIDLTQAIERKMQKNALKYPVDRARGNARKYSEL